MAEPYDDDNLEEDGCTMDFFDETDPSPGPIAGSVYRLYEGEDFAQYLDDDVDPLENQWGTELAPTGVPPDDGAYSRRRRSTANIREKLGRLLLTSASGRSKNAAQVPQQNLSRISDVSFADCKMGNVDRPSEGSAIGSDSGIDCRSSLETESDIGSQASSNWWDTDSRSSSRSRQRPRSSASAIDLPRSVTDYSSNRSGREPRRLDRVEVRPGYVVGETAATARDPARNSSHPERTDSANKILTNTFRKIYNTLSRRKSANLQQMSYAQDYDDVRL